MALRVLDLVQLAVMAALVTTAALGYAKWAEYLWVAALALVAFDLATSTEVADTIVAILLMAPTLAPNYSLYLYIAALAAQLGDVVRR